MDALEIYVNEIVSIGAVIEKYLNLELLKFEGGRIFLTPHGMKLGNVIFADFLL